MFIGAVCSNTQHVLTVQVCGTHTNPAQMCWEAPGKLGWPVAWGASASACSQGGGRGEERGEKEINPHLLGLLRSAASYFNTVFSFEVSKSHCTIL